MATINNVTITYSRMVIAQAPSGEIAPPDNLGAVLTISDATWNVGDKDVPKYADKTVTISATAEGRPFNGSYRIASIRGNDKVIKLAPI